MSDMNDEYLVLRCSVCGGQLPAGHEALDEYLTDEGNCPGSLAVDRCGRVLGCGAWRAEAYETDEEGE